MGGKRTFHADGQAPRGKAKATSAQKRHSPTWKEKGGKNAAQSLSTPSAREAPTLQGGEWERNGGDVKKIKWKGRKKGRRVLQRGSKRGKSLDPREKSPGEAEDNRRGRRQIGQKGKDRTKKKWGQRAFSNIEVFEEPLFEVLSLPALRPGGGGEKRKIEKCKKRQNAGNFFLCRMPGCPPPDDG